MKNGQGWESLEMKNMKKINGRKIIVDATLIVTLIIEIVQIILITGSITTNNPTSAWNVKNISCLALTISDLMLIGVDTIMMINLLEKTDYQLKNAFANLVALSNIVATILCVCLLIFTIRNESNSKKLFVVEMAVTSFICFMHFLKMIFDF